MKKAQKRFLDAYDKSGCNVSVACKVSNVGRRTVYDWIEQSSEFAAAKEEIDEANIDYVETKLMKRIQDDDLTAIIFYLKTKGKKRGYVERVESTGADGSPLVPAAKVLTKSEAAELFRTLENE